jgi:glycosyltransferase involved in cell wall biosynthesis
MKDVRSMDALNLLVLAPGSNPKSISTALVAYSHSEALARIHEVTVVVPRGNESALLEANSPFKKIEAIDVPMIERIMKWSIRWIFKNDFGSQALTAFAYPFAIAFEYAAWKRLRRPILAGEFDLVLRVSPITSVIPSPFAFFMRKSRIPFVIGPINGGLPWPQGFVQAERQKEWISGLRGLSRVLPFAKSTFRYAKAIIAGSSHTYAEFAAYREKLFFVPENGLSKDLLASAVPKRVNDGLLHLMYVGRLVPYKACDLALRSAASLLRSKTAKLTIVGDGPDRERLARLAADLGVSADIVFAGWLSHAETMQQLLRADVLVFPSIREFGGGVVFEALALGVVPVVVDYGGPGDIVHEHVGFRVALTNEEDMVAQIEKILCGLAQDRRRLAAMQEAGRRYASESLSWDGKAKTVTDILYWVLGKGPKPHLPPPKFLWSL